MTRSISVLALLSLLPGCTQDGSAEELSTVSVASLSSPSHAEEELRGDDLSRVDVRQTAASMAMNSELIDELSPEVQAQAAEPLRILSVNCPYTRSAMQLPFALHRVVMGIPTEHLDPLVQRDWEYLQGGLTAHVAALEALGVDLPEPRRGDHLYGLDPALTVSRDHLETVTDPILAAAALIHALPALAEHVDEPTAELIDLHSDRMEQTTGIARPCPRGPWATLPGHPWTLGMQLGGWQDALRRVEPFVEDHEAKSQIRSMIEVLDSYAQASIA